MQPCRHALCHLVPQALVLAPQRASAVSVKHITHNSPELHVIVLLLTANSHFLLVLLGAKQTTVDNSIFPALMRSKMFQNLTLTTTTLADKRDDPSTLSNEQVKEQSSDQAFDTALRGTATAHWLYFQQDSVWVRNFAFSGYFFDEQYKQLQWPCVCMWCVFTETDT